MQRDEARLDGCSARGAVACAGIGAGAAATAAGTTGKDKCYGTATSQLDKLTAAEGVLVEALHDTHPFALEPCSVPDTHDAVMGTPRLRFLGK